MISVMAAVMAVQAALIYQVENHTSVAAGAGIGAAVMLFVVQGAFTVGFQATVWVYPYVPSARERALFSSVSGNANVRSAGRKCYPCDYASAGPPYRRRRTGCSTM